MHLKNLFKLSAILTVVSLWGCAAGPQLQKYPRAQIDRPYTLPYGVAGWNIPGTFDASKDKFGNTSTDVPIPIPVVWNQALSDDWMITWNPFPLEISHQFFYNDTGFLGANFGLGLGYGSIAKTIYTPKPL